MLAFLTSAGRRPRHAQPPPLPNAVLVVFGSALIAGTTMLWNIASSPDTSFDEVSYVTAARNVAQDWRLTWSNAPVFVHPPMSFLAQAGWLRVIGLADGSFYDSLVAARVFAAGVLVFAILLIGLLTAYLAPRAGQKRALLLVGVVVVLVATDPILLRYGRTALIEGFALFASLLTLCIAIWLRDRRPLVYVSVVGVLTGLALLTKEIAVFMVATPLVYAILEHNRRHVAKALGALTAGGLLWAATFVLWPLHLGLWSDFADIKLTLFERLLGLVKTTGWNRPGFGFGTFLSEVLAKVADYGTTYLFLGTGGLALLWLFFHRGDGPYRWLLAWLLTSYAFASYMVAFGTLNEHLFVYLLPAAIAGTVLVGDALLARRVAALLTRGMRPRRVQRILLVPWIALATLLGFSVVTWAFAYIPDGDGIVRSAAYTVANERPCAVVNAIASGAAWSPLMPGRSVTDFSTGEAALSHGVHLFYLDNKDAKLGYALPEMPAFVTSHGVRIATFPSMTYEGVELWQVDSDPYDALADVDPVKGGTFVNTVGSRCGGFPVVDGPTGAFAAGWESLGGKAITGPPMTKSWTQDGRSVQVFRGAVLTSSGPTTAAMPVVANLASTHAAAYTAANLPPVTAAAGAAPRATAEVLAQFTDPAIRAAYLGTAAANPTPEVVERARTLFGEPIGPATRMGDGVLRQAFANGVFERTGQVAHLAGIGRLVIDAGIVGPPQVATTPDASPPLVDDQDPDKPTDVKPFVTDLLAALAFWAGVTAVLHVVTRGRRRAARPQIRSTR